MSKIDLNVVWDDAKAMGLANRDLLSAIAGMFLLLPVVVAQLLIKMPPRPVQGASNEVMLQWYQDYYAANSPVLLGYALIVSFGMLAMLTLLLRHERPTVGESLKAALLVLPAYVLANLLQGIAFLFGFFLFVIPLFYLIGRLSLVAPVAAAERPGNPLVLLRRSFELTRSNGWRIFALLAIIFVTMAIVDLAVTSLTGVVFELLLPTDVADFAMNVVSGLITTALGVVLVLISAALYRSAAAPALSPWQPGA